MDPLVHRTPDFAAAREGEIRRELAMTPKERVEVDAESRRRACPHGAPGDREAERGR